MYKFVCSCVKLPSSGNFTVGKYYYFTYIIDGMQMEDDCGLTIYLGGAEFASCFDATEPVTTYMPMWDDPTVYKLYLILKNDTWGIDEIRACAKVMNINYLEARKKLSQKQTLIAQGRAHTIRDICVTLAPFHVQYKIEPPYPFPYANVGLSKDTPETGKNKYAAHKSVDLYQSLVDCLVRVSRGSTCISQIEQEEAEGGHNTVLDKLEDGEREILAHYVAEVYSGGILEALKQLELLGEYGNMAVSLRNKQIPKNLFQDIAYDYMRRRNGWPWPDN